MHCKGISKSSNYTFVQHFWQLQVDHGSWRPCLPSPVVFSHLSGYSDNPALQPGPPPSALCPSSSFAVPTKSKNINYENSSLYFTPFFCLPEAGDIVTLPMKSVSLVVAYSSMLFPKLFHSPALPGAPSIAYCLSVDWHHSKRCVYFFFKKLFRLSML